MDALVRLRVGEMASHFSLTTHSLRAWERRYGLFAPERTEGGYRMYGPDDLRRVQRMIDHLDAGRPASEAARLVLLEIPVPQEDRDRAQRHLNGARAGDRLQRHRQAAVEACRRLDERAIRAEFDAALMEHDVESVISEVFLPFLPDVAGLEGCSDLTTAHNHFAAGIVRGYLISLARSWDSGSPSRRVWLACPARELHDITLLAFGVLLGRREWSVRFFGANTPLEALVPPARSAPPDLLVVAASRPVVIRHSVASLSALTGLCRVALAGPGSRRAVAATLGMAHLAGDAVSEADNLPRILESDPGADAVPEGAGHL